MDELTLEKFEEASEIVKQVTLETKLVYSEYFSAQTGNRVYFKPENMQYTGAYKVSHRQTIHDEDLAQHADQQRGADQFANIRPFDLLGLLPEQRHEGKECRGYERRRDHRHRMHVMRKDDVVKGVIHRPEDVAHQQGEVGFQSVHPFRRLPRKDKNSARIPHGTAAQKRAFRSGKPYI